MRRLFRSICVLMILDSLFVYLFVYFIHLLRVLTALFAFLVFEFFDSSRQNRIDVIHEIMRRHVDDRTHTILMIRIVIFKLKQEKTQDKQKSTERDT